MAVPVHYQFLHNCWKFGLLTLVSDHSLYMPWSKEVNLHRLFAVADSDEHRDSGCDGDSDAGGDCAAQVGDCGGGGGGGEDEDSQERVLSGEVRTDTASGAEDAGGGRAATSKDVASQGRQAGGSAAGVRPQTATPPTPAAAGAQPARSRPTARGRRRPFSAAPCLPTYQRLPDEGAVAATDGDSPSALTSGGVVCGNLAAALRRRRKGVRGAWQEKPEAGSSAAAEAADVCPSKTGGLLEASRRWRQLYASYRSQHREQWQKEAQEEADSASASAAAAQRVGGGVGGMLGCMAQEETLQPCCAAMAAAYAATPAHWRRRLRRNSSPTGSD